MTPKRNSPRSGKSEATHERNRDSDLRRKNDSSRPVRRHAKPIGRIDRDDGTGLLVERGEIITRVVYLGVADERGRRPRVGYVSIRDGEVEKVVEALLAALPRTPTPPEGPVSP